MLTDFGLGFVCAFRVDLLCLGFVFGLESVLLAFFKVFFDLDLFNTFLG